MKIERISMKSTSCRYGEYSIKNGTMYRVMFSDLPDYLKEQWLSYADGICTKKEMENPVMEAEAIITPDWRVDDFEVKYYFDEYVTFDVKEEDVCVMRSMMAEHCMRYGDAYPDAYDPKTGDDIGDAEWEYLVDQFALEQ